MWCSVGLEAAAALASHGSWCRNHVQVSAASSTGNGLSFMVGRVSYSLGLVGPCIGLDTACSSSLVGISLSRVMLPHTTAVGEQLTDPAWRCAEGHRRDVHGHWRDSEAAVLQVTTHLAHRALLDDEATASVTAGVNVMFSPLITAAICQLQVQFLRVSTSELRSRSTSIADLHAASCADPAQCIQL